MNDPLLLFAIIFYVIVAVGALGYVVRWRRANLLDPVVQCIALISLFTLPLPLRAYQTDAIEGDVTEHLPLLTPYLPAALLLTAIGLIFFVLAYYSTMPARIARHLPSPASPARPNTYTAAICLGTFSIFLLILLTRASGGLLAFVLLGYGSNAETFGRGYLAIGFPWFFVASLMFLCNYAARRRRVDLVIFATLLMAQIFVQLLLGNRSVILYMGLVVLSFVHYAIRPLSAKLLAPIAIAGFLGLNVAGYLRSSQYEDVSDVFTRTQHTVSGLDDSGDLHRGFFYTVTTGEFVVPFETLPQMIRSVGTQIPGELGKTFLRAPVFYIPSALYPDRPAPLGSWYMTQFYGGGRSANEGRQFFFLAEAYLNFGPGGIVLLMLVWGVFWGTLEVYQRQNRGNYGVALFCALAIGYMFRAIAGEFSTLVVGLPEQSLIAAVLAMSLATRFRRWSLPGRIHA